MVGGGIAGLACAWTLGRLLRDAGREEEVVLIEATSRLGGRIRTDEAVLPGFGRFLIEAGPDSFLTRKPEVLRMVEALGLSDRLIATRGSGGSFVYFDRRLRRIPEGLVLMVPSRLSSLLKTDLLSLRGKARALMDLVIPKRRGDGDESLASFVSRRLGREVLERIAEPLIAGIHGADPETMSLKASFPSLLEMELARGSVIRAALAASARRPAPPQAGGRRLSYFMSFDEGMEILPRALAEDLEGARVLLGRPVRRLAPVSGGYALGVGDETVVAEGVVLAIDSEEASGLLRPHFPDLAEEVGALGARRAGTVSLAFRRRDIGVALRGHGFVIPRSEGRPVMGVTYASLKWQNRSPEEDVVLLRAFVGGIAGQEILSRGEEATARAARDQIRELLQIREDVPALLERAYVHGRGMPQYQLGHLERIGRIEAKLREAGPIFVAGAPYYGIGIPDCIASGARAAERLFESALSRAGKESAGNA